MFDNKCLCGKEKKYPAKYCKDCAGNLKAVVRKKKPTKTSLTKKLDKLVSEIVRSRGYCVKCGKTENLQAAHIESRSKRSVRWSMNNLLCLCAGCHFEAHRSPIFFAEFVKEYLGEYEYNVLKERAQTIVKYTIEDLERMLKTMETLKKGETDEKVH